METKRPTSPAAEEILGGYFPVLDHGFVALVDYMGSDPDVESAARVSYGHGTRKRSQTRGLIRYLRRHRHTTPSEMVELKFHCCMPIFVARQWVRHRTACLAEGTEVYFDLPGGIERRGNQLYKLKIEDIWERFQPTRNVSRPDRQADPFFKRDRVRGMHLRRMNEDTGRIEHTRVQDVYRNGPKPVFRMTLADGKQIECSADHRFLFVDGWKTLSDAVGLRRQGGRAVWESGETFLYVNGADTAVPAVYQDERWLARQYVGEGRTAPDIARVCGVTVHTIRKWIRKHGIGLPEERRGFSPGHEPWNEGLTYRLGPRRLSEAWLEANQQARGGEASNLGKGGVSSDRESIGRWTTRVAHRVHQRNGWTCQLCHQRASELHAHHVVPVWADPDRALEEDNLTTLCGECHRQIHGDELEYVEELGGPPVKAEWEPSPRVPWNKLTEARLVRVEEFEYVGMRETYDLEVEGPHHNFVANGIVTHNSLNEYSARYSLMPLLFYTPEEEDFALQSTANRQGRDADADPEVYREAARRWEALREESGALYEWLLEEDVARELARIDLPTSVYTQWYWKIDLHNLFHFLSLRCDEHAQYEIRAYAEVMAGMMKRVAPLSYEAWIDYEFAGAHLSFAERRALARLVEPTEEGSVRVRRGAADDAGRDEVGRDDAGSPPAAPSLDEEELRELGLSGREIRELLEKLEVGERPDFDLDLDAMKEPGWFEERMRAAVPEVDRGPEEGT